MARRTPQRNLFITDNAVLSSLANVSCDIVRPGGVVESEVERVVECIRD